MVLNTREIAERSWPNMAAAADGMRTRSEEGSVQGSSACMGRELYTWRALLGPFFSLAYSRGVATGALAPPLPPAGTESLLEAAETLLGAGRGAVAAAAVALAPAVVGLPTPALLARPRGLLSEEGPCFRAAMVSALRLRRCKGALEGTPAEERRETTPYPPPIEGPGGRGRCSPDTSVDRHTSLTLLGSCAMLCAMLAAEGCVEGGPDKGPDGGCAAAAAAAAATGGGVPVLARRALAALGLFTPPIAAASASHLGLGAAPLGVLVFAPPSARAGVDILLEAAPVWIWGLSGPPSSSMDARAMDAKVGPARLRAGVARLEPLLPCEAPLNAGALMIGVCCCCCGCGVGRGVVLLGAVFVLRFLSAAPPSRGVAWLDPLLPCDAPLMGAPLRGVRCRCATPPALLAAVTSPNLGVTLLVQRAQSANTG